MDLRVGTEWRLRWSLLGLVVFECAVGGAGKKYIVFMYAPSACIRRVIDTFWGGVILSICIASVCLCAQPLTTQWELPLISVSHQKEEIIFHCWRLNPVPCHTRQMLSYIHPQLSERK